MAKKSATPRRDRTSDEIDELKLKELEDIARGHEGSNGDVSLAPDHADVYEALGGDMDNTIDLGNGGVMVNATELCNAVLGEPEEKDDDEENPRRRRMVTAAPVPRKEPKKKSGLIKESNSRGEVIKRSKVESGEANLPAGSRPDQQQSKT